MLDSEAKGIFTVHISLRSYFIHGSVVRRSGATQGLDTLGVLRLAIIDCCLLG